MNDSEQKIVLQAIEALRLVWNESFNQDSIELSQSIWLVREKLYRLVHNLPQDN